MFNGAELILKKEPKNILTILSTYANATSLIDSNFTYNFFQLNGKMEKCLWILLWLIVAKPEKKVSYVSYEKDIQIY